MSKIGSYIIAQIEQGNFTLDERGNYYVELDGDRIRCPAAIQTPANPIQQNEGGRQCADQVSKERD